MTILSSGVLLFPCYGWGGRGLERLSSLDQVKWLISPGPGIWTLAGFPRLLLPSGFEIILGGTPIYPSPLTLTSPDFPHSRMHPGMQLKESDSIMITLNLLWIFWIQQFANCIIFTIARKTALAPPDTCQPTCVSAQNVRDPLLWAASKYGHFCEPSTAEALII